MTFRYKLWQRLDSVAWATVDPHIIKILKNNSRFVMFLPFSGNRHHQIWEYELSEQGYTHLSLCATPDSDILKFLNYQTQRIDEYRLEILLKERIHV